MRPCHTPIKHGILPTPLKVSCALCLVTTLANDESDAMPGSDVAVNRPGSFHFLPVGSQTPRRRTSTLRPPHCRKPKPCREGLEDEMLCRERQVEKHHGAKHMSIVGGIPPAPATPGTCIRDELPGQALPRRLMHKTGRKEKKIALSHYKFGLVCYTTVVH